MTFTAIDFETAVGKRNSACAVAIVTMDNGIHGASLDVCCSEHGIPLKHHEALSDARACAALYLKR